MDGFNYNFFYGESNYGYEVSGHYAWIFMPEVLQYRSYSFWD